CGKRHRLPVLLNASFVPPRRPNHSAVRAFILVLALAAIDPSHVRAADATDEAIRRVRTGTLIIEADPDVEVSVQQLRHEFWFGAALANQAFNGRMNPQDTARYREIFLTNFNAAVTENALKWGDMEPTPGRVNHSTVEAILECTEQHDIRLRGHNIFWCTPHLAQPWLKTMADASLRETPGRRAR